MLYVRLCIRGQAFQTFNRPLYKYGPCLNATLRIIRRCLHVKFLELDLSTTCSGYYAPAYFTQVDGDTRNQM
jgi:hypothetical protein